MNIFSNILRKKILLLIIFSSILGIFMYVAVVSDENIESPQVIDENKSDQNTLQDTFDKTAISCGVMPFSQAVLAGDSVTYTVQITSDILNDLAQLALGNFPRGVVGNFTEEGPFTTPGEVSLVLTTEKNTPTALFSLVILESVTNEVVCQYALEVK